MTETLASIPTDLALGVFFQAQITLLAWWCHKKKRGGPGH